ncbi:MAG: ABC transporter ATP-binding protein, partial [Myxococcales bacterium]|nr:ABC transporter ATP-binding protein [Myxococcales bacterium]
MEEVQALCDEVAIVDHGRLVVHDRLDALLRATASARFDVDVTGADGAPARADDVRTALAAAGLHVGAVTQAERTLEEVFLDLTGRALRDEG